MPLRQFITVVLPAPLMPIMPRMVPRSTRKSSPSTATRPPKLLRRPSTTSMRLAQLHAAHEAGGLQEDDADQERESDDGRERLRHEDGRHLLGQTEKHAAQERADGMPESAQHDDDEADERVVRAGEGRESGKDEAHQHAGGTRQSRGEAEGERRETMDVDADDLDRLRIH